MKRANLNQITETKFDLAIIGAGITGAAIARDASLRGLKVILIEKEDFASGTSSRSSKLIHGGLRYLETMQFRLVAESVRERELSLHLAPHLTKVQPFYYMFYKNTPDKKWQLSLGLTFYDFVSGDWRKRRHKMLSAKDVMKAQPQFKKEGLKGAALFYDVATDDARLTIDMVKSAAEHGAQVINHCEVYGLTYNNNNICNGVKVRDNITNKEEIISATYVINSTGPWSDNILKFEKKSSSVLRPTKGVHIVLRKKDFPIESAIFMRSPDDGRTVWPIPSLEGDRVYVGTTDTTYEGDLDNVHPEPQDIKYLLNVANHLMPKAKLTEKHVIGSWAGLRPLIAPKGNLSNSKTPREHEIMLSDSGVYSIIGGKLTSSRVMAKQLLDKIVKDDSKSKKHLPKNIKPYSANVTPISGAVKEVNKKIDENIKYNRANLISELESQNIPHILAKTWVNRYGYNAFKIAKIWSKDTKFKQSLDARNLTVAELHYCVNEESVFSIDDLLIRRTSAFFWDAKGGLGEFDLLANEMQELLGWSDEEKQKQLTNYRKLVNNHRPINI